MVSGAGYNAYCYDPLPYRVKEADLIVIGKLIIFSKFKAADTEYFFYYPKGFRGHDIEYNMGKLEVIKVLKGSCTADTLSFISPSAEQELPPHLEVQCKDFFSSDLSQPGIWIFNYKSNFGKFFKLRCSNYFHIDRLNNVYELLER